MRTQVIIPAAGVGERLQAAVHKPLVLLNDKPLFVYSLEAFEVSPLIQGIILVVEEQSLVEYAAIVKQYNIKKMTKIVAGGKTRCASVFNGLKVLDEDTEIVVVHDAARPLVSAEIIEAAVTTGYYEAAVIVAVPVKPTIKRVDSDDLYVQETLDRRMLWEVQTPQVFKKDIILRAHNEVKDLTATDDASLVERLGEKVKVITGDYHNIKVTTPDDLIAAEAYLERNI